MATIISLILILICLVVILAIILKKFPALAILNIGNMPGEREAKFKDQLLRQKVERDLSRVGGALGKFWLFFAKRWATFLQGLHKKLKKTKQTYILETPLTGNEKYKRIKEKMRRAEAEVKKDNFVTAEESLIEVISLDQKNLNAFFQLANLYDTQKKWPEARQTYEYALKLARQYHNDESIMGNVTLSEIYFSLSLVEKESDDLEAALENIREALDLEPNNPRFLDLILDLSIMKKDKDLATEYFNKLAAVNPENNKLATWQEKIAELEN